MVLVNIGCGSTWHPAWINLDVRPANRQIRRWNAADGLPFGSSEVDACYSSHFLEHLSREQAQAIVQESRRVLRSEGIIRVAVPDLEAMVREYLLVLSQADSGDETAANRYEWITLELLDQLVRTESGGEMERYLRNDAQESMDYVISRIGPGAKEYMRQPAHAANDHVSTATPLGRQDRTRALGHLTAGLCGVLFGTRVKQAVREGLFRSSGETHRWMYDRFSLRRMLEQAGFEQIRVCTAFESRVPGFASFGLDVVEGRVRKPDSLFMEAVNP